MRLSFCSLAASFVLAASTFAASPTTVPIDVARASAPLFDDAVWRGASDPFVIWNPAKGQWFMYYTQRRASMEGGKGVEWVHGSKIGIAASADGVTWADDGTCLGDHDLTDPLAAADGHGTAPGITWWAPCFLNDGGKLHMFVTRVDGIYADWKGKRTICHFTSDDGVNWTFVNVCGLASERVIDATVYRVGDAWYMVYKNEAAGSNTFCSRSTDLVTWTDAKQVTKDGAMEAPFVFRWHEQWWMIVDAISKKGLRIYKSENGTDGWTYSSTVLGANDGTRPTDRGLGHHPGIVLQGGPKDDAQCLIFYFTQQGRRSVIQLAELELGADGTLTCDRNKFAPTTAPMTRP